MEARSQLRHRPTLRRDGARNSDATFILSQPCSLVKPNAASGEPLSETLANLTAQHHSQRKGWLQVADSSWGMGAARGFPRVESRVCILGTIQPVAESI